MSTGTRVFVARLAGIDVFDPNGGQLGKVRDAVTMLRVDRQPPRVLGLVIELAQRHRIFVPMGRVTRIEAAQVVLSSGTVNMKRFERRSNEILVLSELLDRSITVRESGQSAAIVDAGMEPNRARDWVISRLAVRTHSARLTRRRGQLFQLDWNEVDGLALTETRQGTDTVLAMLSDLRAADVATALQDMTERRRLEVATALDDERLADVLQELPEDEQVTLLGQLADERAADVLEAMDDDDAADLLGEMPQADQERLLQLMEPAEAAPVRRLMTYEEYTAGGLMTSEPIIMLPDATVAEALARVRHPELSPAIASQVYVVRPPMGTPTGRFLGTVHIQRLLREPPSSLVSGVCDNTIDALRPDTPLDGVTRHMATYNLVAVPVVDDHDRLLGAVSVDDVLDHLLPEGWRESEREADREADEEAEREAELGRLMADARARLDQPRVERRGPRFQYDPEAFGRSTERIARFLGTGRYLVYQSVLIALWVVVNTVPDIVHFDPYTFTFLTLILSLQAAYAAPLILLAQNRQDDRDRVNLEADRGEANQSKADLDYLAREIAAIRMALGEVATRDFLRSELARAEAARDRDDADDTSP